VTASERKELVPDDDSYAPQIAIKVDDQLLSDDVLDDVIELKVTLQKDELGGFTMQLANHFEVPDGPTKDGRRAFRHSDSDRIDVFKPIEIQMGYAGRMATMFVGEITMLQPAFPSSGVPTFTVTGTDLLNRLKRAKPDDKKSKAYQNLADWQIADQIAKRHDLKLTKDSASTGEKHTLVTQRDQDDLTFIMYLAKRNNFECTVLIENGKPALYFGKPRDKRGPEAVTQLGLTYGESLISFTPKLRVGQMVSKVTVRGWNARKKEKFQYTATLKDIPKTGGHGKTGAEILEEKAGAKEERIVDRVVLSQEEAKNLAIELLTETANQFLTGNGEAMGEPAIRPQVNLELSGLTRTDHVYGASGYTTSFEVERLRQGKVP
jgi:uncharacterized protein